MGVRAHTHTHTSRCVHPLHHQHLLYLRQINAELMTQIWEVKFNDTRAMDGFTSSFLHSVVNLSFFLYIFSPPLFFIHYLTFSFWFFWPLPSNLSIPVIFSRFPPIFAPRSHAPFLRFTCCCALLSFAFLYFSKFISFAASLLPVPPCLRLFLAPHPFPLLSRIFAELSRMPAAAWPIIPLFGALLLFSSSSQIDV